MRTGDSGSFATVGYFDTKYSLLKLPARTDKGQRRGKKIIFKMSYRAYFQNSIKIINALNCRCLGTPLEATCKVEQFLFFIKRVLTLIFTYTRLGN